MESFVGKRFYLSDSYVDFPYPEDIRVLEDNDEDVVVKQGSRKLKIDKNTLHRYYTMLTPKFAFSIRFFLNEDLRNALILMVNSYKPDNKGNIYFQYINLFKLYMEYINYGKLKNRYTQANISSGKLDDSHVLKMYKNNTSLNESDKLREKRAVVYGYKEDELRDLVKFLPRKKWINIIKNAFNCIDSIYDYKIKTDTKSLLRFFKFMQKDYTTSIETCNITDIIPDTYIGSAKGYKILQILLKLQSLGNISYTTLTEEERDILCSLIWSDHGFRPSIKTIENNIDLYSIRIKKYEDTDNIEDMKIKNPNRIFKVLKLTEQNEFYIVSFKEPPVGLRIFSEKDKALSNEEINKFLSKKTVN